MDLYQQFLKAEAKLRAGEDIVYNALQGRAELKGIVEFAKGRIGGIRATFTPSLVATGKDGRAEIHQLSIVYPSDINRDGRCRVLETALVGEGGNLMYMRELGYSDVCRFDTVDEVVQEILRLKAACPGQGV